LLRAFVDVGRKSKFCANCGNMATQEAFFFSIIRGLPSGPSIPASTYSKSRSCILVISSKISFEGLVVEIPIG
jgi:hypothetical protein